MSDEKIEHTTTDSGVPCSVQRKKEFDAVLEFSIFGTGLIKSVFSEEELKHVYLINVSEYLAKKPCRLNEFDLAYIFEYTLFSDRHEPDDPVFEEGDIDNIKKGIYNMMKKDPFVFHDWLEMNNKTPF